MSWEKKRLRTIKYKIREEIGLLPSFHLLFNLKKKPQARVVNRNHDIVIEGFPRSGNTFLLAYFKELNPKAQIASHFHTYSQVFWGIRYQIPLLIVIRNPVDSVCSLHIREYV
jgi:hypothetical protein